MWLTAELDCHARLPARSAGRYLMRRLAWVLGAAAASPYLGDLRGRTHSRLTFNLFGFSASNGFSLKSKWRLDPGAGPSAIAPRPLDIWKTPGGVTAPAPCPERPSDLRIVLFLAHLPVAVHLHVCLSKCKRPRQVTVHSLAGCLSSTVHSWPRSSSFEAGGAGFGSSRLPVACSSAFSRCYRTQRPLVLRRYRLPAEPSPRSGTSTPTCQQLVPFGHSSSD